MSLIAAEALGIGHGGHTIARNIQFTLGAGEALAILGPNGAGKTTLFRTLLGLIPATGGAVLIDGIASATLTPAALARRVGYVPQSVASLSHFNALDVVTMARAPHLAWYARPGVRDHEIALAAMQEVGAARFQSRSFASLSGGERQLVLIARALAADARCLLLDEPCASLDFGNRLLIEDALNRLKTSGVAIAFTTHDPREARTLAGRSNDRTLSMARDGTTQLDDTLTATSVPRLAALYGVAEERIGAWNQI